MKGTIRKLIEVFPQTYSEELGIDLKSRRSSEIFKWFLASVLFGARINETIAKNTYKTFLRHGITTPQAIQKASWDRMIGIMGEGGYVRYDGKTTRKLWDITKKLLEEYGRIENIYNADTKDVESRLQEFSGIGPTTVNIFLRELRDIWSVDPLPSIFTIHAARCLKLVKSRSPADALKELKVIWKRNKVKNKTFANFETALLRLGKDYCRKNKCKICKLGKYCKKGTRLENL